MLVESIIMNSQTTSFTPQDIKDIFDSDKFKEFSRKSALITLEEKIETGFVIARHLDTGELWFPQDVKRGEKDRLYAIGEEVEIPDMGPDMYCVASLHWHPGFDLTPSPWDLFASYKLTTHNYGGVRSFPIMINGIVTSNNSALMLFYQHASFPEDELEFEEQWKFILGNIDQLMRDFKNRPNLFSQKYHLPFNPNPRASKPDRIAEFKRALPYIQAHKMRQTGYNAAILRLTPTGIHQRDLAQLEQFTFDIAPYEAEPAAN